MIAHCADGYQSQETRVPARRTTIAGILCAAALGLHGCTSNLDTTKMDDDIKARTTKRTLAQVQQDGAAIALRVTYAGERCGDSSVLLQPIISGRIVNDRTNWIYSNELIAWKALSLKSVLNYNSDTRVAFRGIKPGQYVVTSISCSWGKRTIAVTTWDKTVLGFPAPSSKLLPTKGPNFISIGAGQITDAGSVDIIPIDMPRMQGKGSGLLLASEAPPIFREAVKLNLPDLYPKITYKKLSFYPGVLMP